MLTGIHVRDLALIEEAEADFSEHLNILTGETGAGKSILIGSVTAGLGGRVSKDMIRRGASDALVELFFTVQDPLVLSWLDAHKIDAPEGEVLISRRITQTRSVCRVNGEAVSVQMVRELGERLIDIHGQHEHQSLLRKQYHLEVLDAFAHTALGDRKRELAEAYDDWTALRKELAEAQMDETVRRRDMSFLEFEIQEIESAHLAEGEDDLLEAAYRKMANGRQILKGADTAYQLTGYDSGAGDLTGRALRELAAVEDYDRALQELRMQLTDIDNLINDFNRELSGYISDLTFDEQEFQETGQRLDLINGLKAKYGPTIGDVLDYAEGARQKLLKLRNYDLYLEDLCSREQKAAKRLQETAQEVSRIRREQGEILAKQITRALKDLNFMEVRFGWQFEALSSPTRNGIDEAQFLISVNPGEEMKPLAEVASGGELSRIMLAIKSVLADADAIETLIFDEIDAGISGRTAQKVSEKLAAISRKHQVLCITHLPQIAAMADSHFLIEKETRIRRGGVPVDREGNGTFDSGSPGMADPFTVTKVRPLNREQMIGEIARLLGGAKITEAVLRNAKEMKELADSIKEPLAGASARPWEDAPETSL